MSYSVEKRNIHILQAAPKRALGADSSLSFLR